MTHYGETINQTVSIFGLKIEGNRKKENRPNKQNWIRIRSFKAYITKKCDKDSEQIALKKYSAFDLHGTIGDCLSGNRGIIEPADKYKGAGFITKKKPKKATRHNSQFSVSGYPAVCYYDNMETEQKRIKLTEIKSAEISLK